tara:strand:+ start:20 stop:919 length:900 start_codon:yes stop_codon:yes gene_type:complete
MKFNPKSRFALGQDEDIDRIASFTGEGSSPGFQDLAFSDQFRITPEGETETTEFEKVVSKDNPPIVKKEGIVSEIDDPTFSAFTKKEEEPELKKEQVVKTPTIKETEDNEVTMTDLERALGLDDARKEYVGDALAAASKAFFEGKGFGAISDAAQVKSKAPEIKRLAGLEEFKAKKAQELYKTKLDAQLKQKLGTRGSLQKDIEYLAGLSGSDRIAALGKLGYKAPSLSAAIKELKVTGQSPDPSTIVSLAQLYIGPDFKGVVSATEDMTEKSKGTYITEDGAALIIVDEKGNTRVQQL